MFKTLESGILDKTRLVSNILMIVLLCGNVFFSVHFISSIAKPILENEDNTILTIRSTRALKDFINKVLAQSDVSFEDRVMLENDILQIHDPVVTAAWDKFVSSKTSKEGQDNAVKLMSLLVDRI